MHKHYTSTEVEYSHRWFCLNAPDFDEWYDKETFDWVPGLSYLIWYCAADIETWCHADIIIDDYNTDQLIGSCIPSMDIWYDHIKTEYTKLQLQTMSLYK